MRHPHGGLRTLASFPLATKLWARYSCTTLFIGGLSYDTNEAILKSAFEQYGEIIEVKVICDRKKGRSKAYGFVQFNSDSAANTAVKDMDGQLLDGRNINVEFAHKG